MTKYNKFWYSLLGPLATGLATFGVMDIETAQAATAALASLVGSLAVVFGPANK
jgi:hypothetical protein